VPCSASGGYADLVVLEQPTGSALERSYPVMRIMLSVGPNDIRGLGQIDLEMRGATQDVVPATRLGLPIDHPPSAARGDRAATPPLGPPAPARYCAVPHINIFQFFLDVLYICLRVAYSRQAWDYSGPGRAPYWRLTWRSDLGCMRTFTRSGSGLLGAVARRCASLVRLVLLRPRLSARVRRLRRSRVGS
jgi:hypothetical protein